MSGYSASGVPVSQQTAVSSAAVYAALRAVAEDLGKLPLEVRTRNPVSGTTPDLDHPLNAVLDRPNPWQNRFDLVAFVATSLALNGNAYIFVLRDPAGRPVRLYPIAPPRVSVLISPSGQLLYNVSHPLIANDAGFTATRDDVMHIKGMSLNGYMGVSPLQAHVNSMGLSLALDEYAGALFRNGTALNGVLKMASTANSETKDVILESWRARNSGVRNAGNVALLEDGWSYDTLGMSNDAAQFLETRKFQVIEIARIFRIPPHKLFALEDSHYNNLTSQNQSYADDTLYPLAVRFEQEAARVLLFEHERATTEVAFDFAQLHRADIQTRYAAYKTALGGVPFKTVNEVRRDEGLPPLPGYDVIPQPLNMGTDKDANPKADEPAPDRPDKKDRTPN